MYKTFSEVKKALSAGRTVVEIVNDYLSAIEAAKDLNAFLEVFETTALQQAEAVAANQKAGTAGKLAGMVIGLKDNICYKGHKVSRQCLLLAWRQPLLLAAKMWFRRLPKRRSSLWQLL